MPISFVRIDDRVIHGQIITRWTRMKECHGILVIDDTIANDPMQKKIFSHAAPRDVKVGIYTVEEGIEKIGKAVQAKNSYFVIVRSPVTLQRLSESGAEFGGQVNVGPMSARPGADTIGKNVAVTVEERHAFDYLDEKGMDITFQLVPEETPYRWGSIN
jgi:mannose/fructose/N-acetylgalactosamine-specific phosphotransferase system component IIB